MKIYWHIIRTLIFYLIGLLNTVFVKSENIGSLENYAGYLFLILAVIDTIVIIKNRFKKWNFN